MSSMNIKLPKDKKKLGKFLQHAITRITEINNIRRIEWVVNKYYLTGSRNFSDINYVNGTVRVNYATTDDDMDFKWENVVGQYNLELGRRLKFDPSPSLDTSFDFSLDGLRKSAIAKAVLTNITNQLPMDDLKSTAIQTQLLYGYGALVASGMESVFEELTEEGEAVETKKVRPILSVVPPWELGTLPVDPGSADDIYGYVRTRKVPLEWLKEKDGISPPKGGWGKVVTTTGPLYESNSDMANMEGGLGAGLFQWDNYDSEDSAGGVDDKGNDPTNTAYVELSEVYLKDVDDTLQRYILYAGTHVLKDIDMDKVPIKERFMMPLVPFHNIPLNGNGGRPFVSLLLGLNIQTELMLKTVFKNIKELDAYGMLLIPTTMGINQNSLRSSKFPKTLSYEPDITAPNHKPDSIAPINSGEAPLKIIDFAVSLQDKVASQPAELLSGGSPGRVDSAQALGFLWETGSVPLAGPMSSLATAFVKIYAAYLAMARNVWDTKDMTKLGTLDDSMVGLVIDTETWSLDTEKNSVPHPTEVSISVASQLPKSKEQRKVELKEMLQLGVITPRTFRRLSRIEGLDFPLGDKAEFENYRKAVIHNIIQFNDGETPGKWISSESADIPEIHIEVINDFMAKPEFSLASKEVRDAFIQRKSMYMGLQGNGMPPSFGYPEDEAMLQEQLQGDPTQPMQPGRGMEQGMGQGGGGGQSEVQQAQMAQMMQMLAQQQGGGGGEEMPPEDRGGDFEGGFEEE